MTLASFARLVAIAGMLVYSRLLAAPGAAAADWDPQRYAAEDKIEIRTVEEGAGDHWFPVWVVVIEGEVYVRLGNRAASRVENNARKPIVSLRAGGEEFDSVETEPVPELAEEVATAMAEKYWFDVVVRFFPHPLTLRLSPLGPNGS